MDYEVKGVRPGGRPKKTRSAVVKKRQTRQLNKESVVVVNGGN